MIKKIKKGDTVRITVGKDLGKSGKVEKVLSDKGKVIVQGMNIVKRHRRPTQRNTAGGIMDMAMPLDISNVQLICPQCGKATRVGWTIEGEKKVRVCKKCKATAQ